MRQFLQGLFLVYCLMVNMLVKVSLDKESLPCFELVKWGHKFTYASKITMHMKTFVNSTISKSISPGNYSSTLML